MGWRWSTWASDSQATAGIGVGRTETVPGSSVNGGGGDQEVGNIFNCEEGEYDLARLAGGCVSQGRGGDCHKTGVAGPGMGCGRGPGPLGGRELPQGIPCHRDTAWSRYHL